MTTTAAAASVVVKNAADAAEAAAEETSPTPVKKTTTLLSGESSASGKSVSFDDHTEASASDVVVVGETVATAAASPNTAGNSIKKSLQKGTNAVATGTYSFAKGAGKAISSGGKAISSGGSKAISSVTTAVFSGRSVRREPSERSITFNTWRSLRHSLLYSFATKETVQNLNKVIFPHGKWIRRWDLLMLIILIILVFTLPYQIGT